MIIKTWIVLAVIAAAIQFFLAIKKKPHWIGMLLPMAFFAFAVYAWADLASVGIGIGVLLSFMIPPAFLGCWFELFFWRTKWKERLEE
ncbi:MAG TPA: hypothetical protein DCZ40_09960 [Lachnospiraceae bacterium]|nr:hypothetical protein [Lachnospiraceae bacterium]